MAKMASSTLNPDTPIFVSSAYRAVEDFSDQSVEVVENASCSGDSKLRPEGAKDHECETSLSSQHGSPLLQSPMREGSRPLGLPPMCKDESGNNKKVSMVSEVDVVGTKKAYQRFKDLRILRLICSQR
nr:protein EARLY RESPONSIVE TO DEHYDRATION 15-like [Ipomoea batatas]